MASEKKAYKGTDRIIIENSKTGELYGVTGSEFEKRYEPLGFRAVSFEDGSSLTLTKAEQDAASRAAAPATVNVGPAGQGLEPVKETKTTAKKPARARTRARTAAPARTSEPAPAPVPEG